MLDEGLRAGLDYLGIAHRNLCHVEREAHAAAVLVARMEEGSLDAAPVWPDVTTFDAAAFRGKVDCIVAGFPCQDLSVAGKRAGLDGHRSGLFYEVVRIATDSGAWLMFLENVGGIASATATVVDEAEGELDERAASRVVGELADLGWNAEWLHLSASDVGASHGRERWFCLAWRMADAARNERDRGGHREGCSGRRVCEAGNEMANAEGRRGIGIWTELARRAKAQSAGDCMGHAASDGWHEGRAELPGWTRRPDPGWAGMPVADSSQPRLQGHQQSATHEQDGRTDGRSRNHADQLPNFIMMNFSHPDPMTTDGHPSSESAQNSRRHLNPLFAAWLMGWPSTWAIAEPHASSAQATALWRSKLRQRLSSLLDAPESFHKEVA